MDRQGYAQLNRIEEKLDHAIEGIKLGMNLDAIEVLEDWYEAEVLNEKGKLHHLNKDEKLKDFINELVQEEKEDNNASSETTPQEEYRQK